MLVLSYLASNSDIEMPCLVSQFRQLEANSYIRSSCLVITYFLLFFFFRGTKNCLLSNAPNTLLWQTVCFFLFFFSIVQLHFLFLRTNRRDTYIHCTKLNRNNIFYNSLGEIVSCNIRCILQVAVSPKLSYPHALHYVNNPLPRDSSYVLNLFLLGVKCIIHCLCGRISDSNDVFIPIVSPDNMINRTTRTRRYM